MPTTCLDECPQYLKQHVGLQTSAEFYGFVVALSFWLQLDDFNNVEFDIRTPEQWLEPGPQERSCRREGYRGRLIPWADTPVYPGGVVCRL